MTKFSAGMEAYLVEPEMLKNMKVMSLRERVAHLRLHENINISPYTLRKFYLRNNVRYKTVDLHSTSKYRQRIAIKAQQEAFVAEFKEYKER